MSNKNKLPFTRKNFIWLFITIAILFIGFFIMTLDKEPHGFGFLGITLGPIIVMSGFIFGFFAIFRKA
ncbi:MAG: DUF3098 domain-containing protein [Cyclobacteriaceae bacterium]|nr:DUF3098 domain-containing protein [Cyclobacteriaceae bacterium]